MALSLIAVDLSFLGAAACLGGDFAVLPMISLLIAGDLSFFGGDFATACSGGDLADD